MAQLSYGYTSQKCVPGGLYDLSPHSIVARSNEEETAGVIKFGYGVVQGGVAGETVKLPTDESTAQTFEGVVTTQVTQADLDGNIALKQYGTLGLVQYGKVWVKVADGLTVTYGDPVYLVNTGADVGKFTNEDSGIAISGRFIGGVDSGDIAPIEIFNYVAPATTV